MVMLNGTNCGTNGVFIVFVCSHEWDWKAAVDLGAKWICTHCRQMCPERAQCAIYRRTNERRREQQQQQRSAKVNALPLMGAEKAVEMLRLPPLRIAERLD